MTRETKIGLLVGLAFIIVMGILLENHAASVSEPKPPPLQTITQNVAAGAGMPRGELNDGQINSSEPHQVIHLPAETVPHIREIHGGDGRATVVQHTDNGISDVQIGSGDNGSYTVRSNGVAPHENRTNVNTPPDSDPLKAWANRVGEPLEDVAPRNPVTTSGHDYVAQSGDSLSKMAQKFLGSNTKANRDAIVRANPSLSANPDKIIVGKTYVIPGSASPAAPAPTPAPEIHAVAPSSPPPGSSGAENFYTTQSGDSLWRIATEQCGNAGAVAAIKALNPDRFPDGSDVVQTGWKLRLPAKTVASIN